MTHTTIDLRYDNVEFKTDDLALTVKGRYTLLTIFAKDDQLKELRKQIDIYLEDSNV